MLIDIITINHKWKSMNELDSIANQTKLGHNWWSSIKIQTSLNSREARFWLVYNHTYGYVTMEGSWSSFLFFKNYAEHFQNLHFILCLLIFPSTNQNIFPMPSFLATDSWIYILRHFSIRGAICSVLSNKPNSPPVCMKRTFLPSHLPGLSAMSFIIP